MSYTIQDLLNKHVVIGTPESTVFLGECERLGVKCGRFGDDSPTKFAKDKEAVKVVYLKCLDMYTLTQSSVSYLKSINSEPFKLKEVTHDVDESIQLSAKLEAITAERDQLAATVATYRRIVDELSQPLAQGTSADFIAGVRSCVTQLEDVWLGNHESLIADIRAKAICHFKDELLAATSVMFRPHIEGVCAVVTERMQLAKDGAK